MLFIRSTLNCTAVKFNSKVKVNYHVVEQSCTKIKLSVVCVKVE